MEQTEITPRLELTGQDLGISVVTCVGFDSIGASRSLREHVHPCHEITYVFKGALAWQLADGTVLSLSGGDMAVTQPAVRHKGHLEVIQPSSFFWCHVDCSSRASVRGTPFTRADLSHLDRLLCSAGNRVSFAEDALHDLLLRLYSVARQGATHGDSSPASADARLAAAGVRGLLAQIVVAAATRANEGKGRGMAGPYVAAALRFMDERLDQPLGVPDVARHLGISPSRLHALFRDETGMSPMDCLNRKRIERAMTLLVSGARSVSWIAAETGFSSPQYLATCFRKYTGMSPGEYRSRQANHG